MNCGEYAYIKPKSRYWKHLLIWTRNAFLILLGTVAILLYAILLHLYWSIQGLGI